MTITRTVLNVVHYISGLVEKGLGVFGSMEIYMSIYTETQADTCKQCRHICDMSHGMEFPTMWYVRPAKPQISLRIRAVRSEPLLVAWIFYEC